MEASFPEAWGEAKVTSSDNNMEGQYGGWELSRVMASNIRPGNACMAGCASYGDNKDNE